MIHLFSCFRVCHHSLDLFAFARSLSFSYGSSLKFIFFFLFLCKISSSRAGFSPHRLSFLRRHTKDLARRSPPVRILPPNRTRASAFGMLKTDIKSVWVRDLRSRLPQKWARVGKCEGKPSELRQSWFPLVLPFQGTLENRVHTSYYYCVK